jgi:hypothetical protein
LFACYEFYEHYGNKPKDWRELFEFLRQAKAKGILKETALEKAKAGMSNG